MSAHHRTVSGLSCRPAALPQGKQIKRAPSQQKWKLAFSARILAIALPFLSVIPEAAAQNFTDPAQLDREIATYASAKLGHRNFTVTQVDRRLRLAPCDAPHIFNWHGIRQNSVKVECHGTTRWRIFVPIRISQPLLSSPASAASAASAAAPTASTASTASTAPIAAPTSAMRYTPSARRGSRVASNRAGNAQAEGPTLIKRGDAVTIIARGHGFAISRSAEALENGKMGEWIRVRPVAGGLSNASNGRGRSAARAEPIRARIIRPGQLEIPVS